MVPFVKEKISFYQLQFNEGIQRNNLGLLRYEGFGQNQDFFFFFFYIGFMCNLSISNILMKTFCLNLIKCLRNT